MNIRKEYLKITAPNTNGSRVKQKIQAILKNPLAQFGLLGIALIFILVLSEVGAIPSSLSEAFGYIMIYSIASIGFCLLLGYSGLASLGTAGFIGIGALLTYYGVQQWKLTVLPALLIAGIVSIILGVIVGFVSLRIEGIYLAIMTLCLSEALVRLLKALEGGTIKVTTANVTLFGLVLTREIVFVMIALVLITLLVFTANLIKSPTGRAMQAMKSSTSAAQAMGISLMKYRLLAFVIATLFATVAGFFYMLFIRSMTMTTSTVITLSMSLNILGAVIIGGAKSLWGTLFGTFFVYGLQTVILSEIEFFQKNPAITVLFTGILMILIVMFFPGGFTEIILRIRIAIMNAVKKWRVRTYGIEE